MTEDPRPALIEEIVMLQEKIRLLKLDYDKAWSDLAYAEDELTIAEGRLRDLEEEDV